MKSFIQLTRIVGYKRDVAPITVRIDAISTIQPRWSWTADGNRGVGTTLILHPDSPGIDVVEPYRTVLSMLNGARGTCPDCGDVFNTSTGICSRCDKLEPHKYELEHEVDAVR